MQCLNIETIPIDGISRWVDVATFDRNGCSKQDAISGFFASPEFARAFLSPNEPSGTGLHGPYPVSAMSLDDYVASSVKDFEDRLRWFCFEYPDNPKYRVIEKDVAERLADLEHRLRQEAECVFVLRKLNEERDSDIGWVLLVFEEFIFLTKNNLLSVVIGED